VSALRVLQLTTDLRLAGAERVVIALARGLRARGVECAVAGLFEGGEERGRARAVLEEEGFPVYCAGMERKRRLHRLAGLRRFAAGWRPDLTHCHMFHGNAAGALLRLSGVPAALVWTHHTIERRPLPWRRAFCRLFGRLADCRVSVSDAVLRHQRGARRQEVVHDGLELAPFLAVQSRPGSVFGAVGRLIPGKGFDVLVRAFAGLARQDARLRIAGEGPERVALTALAQREGVADRVELAGFVEDVPAFLSGVNVFVNPTRGEGFGLALLEAMAAGLPCIASRVDSLPEVGGDCVTWVPAGDAGALGAAMAAALRTPRPAQKIAAQRARAARFSAEAMVERYLVLYRSLAPKC